MKKTFFKALAAILLVSAMAMGVCACSASAVNQNPVIGKVGNVEITLNDYQDVYMTYYQYIQMGYMNKDGLNAIIKNQLIRDAVTLNQAYEQGITVDEKELDEKIQEELKKALDSMKIDEGITDPDEQKAEKLKQLKKTLRKNGTSYNKYLKDLEEALRKDMLKEGLRDKINAAVEKDFDDNTVEPYFNDELKKLHDEYIKAAQEAAKEDDKANESDEAAATEEPKETAKPNSDKPDSDKTDKPNKPKDKYANIKDFQQKYTEYITNDGLVPFFCPEGMFTVKHILIKFSQKPKDPAATPVPSGTEKPKEPEKFYNEETQKKLDRIHDALKEGNTTTVEDFEKLIEELGDDPGMKQDGYKEHGYLMHEGLVDTYFPGFGLYAMKLMYGDDWEPEPEPETGKPEDSAKPTDAPESPKPTDKPSEKPENDALKYEFKGYYTIKDADGNDVKVAEVEASMGTHFIIINEKKLSEYKDEGFTDEEGNVLGYDLKFVNDKEDDFWKNIRAYLLDEAQQEKYNKEFEGWKTNTVIKLKNKYIDQLAASLYGLK